MKRYLVKMMCALMLMGSPLAQAQEINGRFMDNDHLLDMQLYFSKNLTPGANARFWALRTTFVKNYLFLDGDGHNDPDIGLSLNPSLNVGDFLLRAEQGTVSNILLQDGMFNFVPSLYMRIRPDERSRFHFFADAGAGVKFFNKLDDINEASSVDFLPGDNDNGLFDQWTFHLGAGLEFDGKFSIYARQVNGWHDVTKSTTTYYKKYINPNTTFVRYINIRGNFAVNDRMNFFLSWDGYRKTMNNERIVRAGIAFRPVIKAFSTAPVDLTLGDRAKLQKRSKSMEKAIDRLLVLAVDYPEVKVYAEALMAEKNELLLQMRALEREQEAVQWLKELNQLIRQIDKVYRQIKKSKAGKRLKRKEKKSLPFLKKQLLRLDKVSDKAEYEATCAAIQKIDATFNCVDYVNKSKAKAKSKASGN